MTPAPIQPAHKKTILSNNAQFVHWLSPLDEQQLDALINLSDYARQLREGEGCLLAYDGNGGHRHKNVDWLSRHLSSYLYIDRIIIGADAHGEGLGTFFYEDVARFARAQGFGAIACEVNTKPDNPASHRFHLARGFTALGEATYQTDAPNSVSVRYYVRHL